MIVKSNAWALLSLFFIFLTVSCAKKVKNETQVYSNDFESGDLAGITNGIFESYNSTMVLGRYNNGGFELQLLELPPHDLVQISFDLYIHDSWDGNEMIEDIGGPDIWKMKVDGKVYINTTFSNAVCPVNQLCFPQSYPANYLNSNNGSRKGAAKINLPGACYPDGTSTLYKIEKTIQHSEAKLLLQCVDELLQRNTDDAKCDESWSVDNINIHVIALE